MIVPAVTEVSFPQAAHSQLARRRFSSQPLSWPQAGQTKPSGQRLAARCRAQEASSGKPASKAARDMGRSYFQRLAITKHYTNILPTPTRNSTSRQTGLKGISPLRQTMMPSPSPLSSAPRAPYRTVQNWRRSMVSAPRGVNRRSGCETYGPRKIGITTRTPPSSGRATHDWSCRAGSASRRSRSRGSREDRSRRASRRPCS